MLSMGETLAWSTGNTHSTHPKQTGVKELDCPFKVKANGRKVISSYTIERLLCRLV